MPSVHSIKISHFRGVDSLEQTFDSNNLIVFIGRCDSGKSTVLKAISLALCPYWNPTFSATDFFSEDLSKPIEIEVTVKDLPDELLSDKKYGLHYRLLKNGEITDDITDADQSSNLLTIKLIVDSDLEPKWYVINGRNGIEDIEIKQADRAKFKAFYISDYVDSHFTFSKGSPLYSLLNKALKEKNSIGKKLLEVAREANNSVAESMEFKDFDDTLDNIKSVASSLGLKLGDLQVLLEMKENVYTQSNITLHEGEIPFHLHGKGSKRLLSIAIQLNLIEDGGIILIDEIEQGLEPDRVVNIVKLLKHTDKGQVFITTHSSEALCEVDYNNVYIVKKGEANMQCCDSTFESLLRSAPSTFFAKRIVCCEGKTEYGFIRSLGEYLRVKESLSLASLGICPVYCGGGTKHLDWALKFKSLGYEVSVFSDNDELGKYQDRINQLEINNIPLFTWEEGNCIEQQIIKDFGWVQIVKLLEYIVSVNSSPLSINDRFIITEDTDFSLFSEEEQKTIIQYITENAIKNNKKGKVKVWFKDIDGGEFLGKVCMDSIKDLPGKCNTISVINNIIKWLLLSR